MELDIMEGKSVQTDLGLFSPDELLMLKLIVEVREMSRSLQVLEVLLEPGKLESEN